MPGDVEATAFIAKNIAPTAGARAPAAEIPRISDGTGAGYGDGARLTAQGTRFQLNELEGLLRGIKEMREPSLEYQVVRPDGGDDPLVVRVEMATEDPALRDAAATECATQVRETLGIVAQIEVLERDTIPRAGYKATRVIDPE